MADEGILNPNERVLTPEEEEQLALRQQAQTVATTPGAAPTAAVAAPAPAPAPAPAEEQGWWNNRAVDPWAAQGGGVFVEGYGWKPRSMVEEQAALHGPTSVPAATPVATAATPGTPGATTTAGQAQAASGYTPTPLANPTNPTSNAGSQDVVRNSYLQMATQPIVPSANDAAVRRPADAYAANVERSVRSNIADAAEANGPYATGAQSGQARMIRERGGALTGEYESNLVLREMTARRSEVQQALSALGGTITEDQRQALQRELARIDASLRSQALGQQGDQFNKELGVNIADKEAYWNDVALRHILQGV